MSLPLVSRSVLDEDILTNDTHYFFSIHRPKFQYMEEMMARSLEKRFGHSFRVIRILRGRPNAKHDHSNYIIVNAKALEEEARTGVGVLDMPEVQDTNAEFSRDEEVLSLAKALKNKQGKLFILPFQSDLLSLDPNIFTVLGPDREIVERVDSKAEQLAIFSKLDLPHIRYRIFSSSQDLKNGWKTATPFYISAPHSAGGRESGFIRNESDMRSFLDRLRPINQEGPFAALDIFEDIDFSPNINVAVNRNGEVRVLVISDQIMNGTSYYGNIYPSLATKQHRQVMYETATKVGSYLADSGYRGLFGCDFLIDKKGDIVVVDLNPRHQGGYAVNGLSLEALGYSLTDIELEALLDVSFSVSQEDINKELSFSWMHHGINIEQGVDIVPNLEVSESIDMKTPFYEIGASWSDVYYKPGMFYRRGELGHYIKTAENRELLK